VTDLVLAVRTAAKTKTASSGSMGKKRSVTMDTVAMDTDCTGAFSSAFSSQTRHRYCTDERRQQTVSNTLYYYYYYAAFNAPCVGHKDDESTGVDRVVADPPMAGQKRK